MHLNKRSLNIHRDGLAEEDKSKKIGLFKRLRNIEDNLAEVDDDNNKVGIFRIIKDIKDKGIKIDNDDEAIREIRERIQELKDDGVEINNFDEMKDEIAGHIQNLENQGINVKIDEDQINDLIDKKFSKKDDSKDNLNELQKFAKINNKVISTFYNRGGNNKININTKEINEAIIDYNKKNISMNQFMEKFDKFNKEYEIFKNIIIKKKYYW